MEKGALTVLALSEAKAVTDDAVNAAVDAVLANLATGAYQLIRDYVLDLNAAIKASTFASLILRDIHATERHKRHVVWNAILLAQTLKG